MKYNGTTNTNASEVARRAKARATYANQLVNTKTLDLNCQNRVAAGPAATTSYDGLKYMDQRVGAVFTTPVQAATIVETSPCAGIPTANQIPIVYPSYELTCDDSAGIQIMASGSFTTFSFTTTSQGAGVLEFQFFLGDSFISDQLVVLGVDSNLITPPPGIDEVRYVFRCSPYLITLRCQDSKVLQWTIPYSFTNPADLSGSYTTLTLYKHPIADGQTITQNVYAGSTYVPTPAWGYDAWDIAPCVGGMSFTGATSSVVTVEPGSGLQLGAGDFTIDWYQWFSSEGTNEYPTVFTYKTPGYTFLVGVYFIRSQNKVGYFELGGLQMSEVIPIPFENSLLHFAVCRSGGTVYLYCNGFLVVSGASSLTITDPDNRLFVGNDTSASGLGFEGMITNFRWTVGYALYPNGTFFTPPAIPVAAVTGVQLLLLAESVSTLFLDSSSAQRTVTGVDVTWTSRASS